MCGRIRLEEKVKLPEDLDVIRLILAVKGGLRARLRVSRARERSESEGRRAEERGQLDELVPWQVELLESCNSPWRSLRRGKS